MNCCYPKLSIEWPLWRALAALLLLCQAIGIRSSNCAGCWSWGCLLGNAWKRQEASQLWRSCGSFFSWKRLVLVSCAQQLESAPVDSKKRTLEDMSNAKLCRARVGHWSVLIVIKGFIKGMCSQTNRKWQYGNSINKSVCSSMQLQFSSRAQLPS